MDFRREKIAMVFQHYGLLPHRTVLDNVCFGLKLRGEEKEAQPEGVEALEQVGLKVGEVLSRIPERRYATEGRYRPRARDGRFDTSHGRAVQRTGPSYPARTAGRDDPSAEGDAQDHLLRDAPPLRGTSNGRPDGHYEKRGDSTGRLSRRSHRKPCRRVRRSSFRTNATKCSGPNRFWRKSIRKEAEAHVSESFQVHVAPAVNRFINDLIAACTCFRLYLRRDSLLSSHCQRDTRFIPWWGTSLR